MLGRGKRSKDKRVALVIGNGSYTYITALATPRKDADDVTIVLTRLGFQVFPGTDLDKESLVKLFAEFETALKASKFGLIYYSGHGIQNNEINYLVPIDANVLIPPVEEKLISVQDWIGRISAQNVVALVFLDACRDNPLVEERQRQRQVEALSKGLPSPGPIATGRGLAAIAKSVTRGVPAFMAYAAAPGEVAYVGKGPRSIFTDVLLGSIEAPDLKLSDLMAHVTALVKNRVKSEMNRDQEPWIQSSMIEPFFFNPGSLISFTSNIIGFWAFLVALLIHSWVISDGSRWLYATPTVLIMLLTLWLFLDGVIRSYRSLRGESLDEDNTLSRSIRGGYFSSIFAALFIALPYYASSSSLKFGELLSAHLVASVLTGTTLGPLSYIPTRRSILNWNAHAKPSRTASLFGGIGGGLIAGIILGPLFTWFFGQLDLEPVSLSSLLAGSTIATAMIIFFISSYSVEPISYRRIVINLAASVIATLCVVLACGLAALASPFQDLSDNALATYDGRALVLTGLVLGPTLGIILGSVIGLTTLFVEIAQDWTTKEPRFFRYIRRLRHLF